ncbi:hypothetical protein ACOBV8_18300 (plasmid) [Pseudoalteromonas espejiana]
MKKLILSFTLLLSFALLLSANAAYADECTLNIDATDMMQVFNQNKALKAVKRATVKLKHM